MTFRKQDVQFPAEGGIAFGVAIRAQHQVARLPVIAIAHGYAITFRERKMHV